MKRKLMLIFVLMIILFPALFFTSTLAAETQSVTENLSDKLTVEILEDGRVAPVENPENLSEEDLDLILKRIGYSDNLIEIWFIDHKRELVSYGGKVMEGYVSDYKQESIFSGDDAANDFETAFKEATVNKNQNGYIRDGKWSAIISAEKIDESSKQYLYVIRMYYYWDEQPIANYGDSASLSWGPLGVPVAGTAASQNGLYYINKWISFENDIDRSSIYGLSAKIIYDKHLSGRQMGYLQQQVWLPKELTGEGYTISGSYYHPYGPEELTPYFLKHRHWIWDYGFIVG